MFGAAWALLIQSVIEDTEMGCAPTAMGDPDIVLWSPLSTDADAVRVLSPSSASKEEGEEEDEEEEEDEDADGSTPGGDVVHATVDVAGSDAVPALVELLVPVELAVPDEVPDPLTVTTISGESSLSSPLES